MPPVGEMRVAFTVYPSGTVEYRVESMTRKGDMRGVMGAGSFETVKERVSETFAKELKGVVRRLKQQAKRRKAGS
jgi:hypothetical protein